MEGGVMKRLLIATAALAALLGSPAFGADMAAPVYKAPTPPPPAWSWTGFYIGVNAGWKGINGAGMTSAPNDAATTAFNTACITAGACPQNYGNASGHGFIGGGQIGYNWQIQNYLVGLETDFDGTSARATQNIGLTAPGFLPFVGSQSTRENYLGTVRGRLGVLATPTLLAYVTGGYAYSSLNRTWAGSFPTFGSAWSGGNTSIVSGWTVGTGLEWAVGNGFLLGAEYLYVRLDGGNSFLTTTQNAGCTPGGVPSCTFNITSSSLNDNIVRARLSYKFN
jgi:outer membrane immunogenic protein